MGCCLIFDLKNQAVGYTDHHENKKCRIDSSKKKKINPVIINSIHPMEYKIYTGSLLSVKEGFFKWAFRFMYCGMPNKSTFALTPYIAKGYQGFSPTIYYKADSQVIHLMDKEFDVIEVNADYIIIGD